jgi:hypothetical protein
MKLSLKQIIFQENNTPQILDSNNSSNKNKNHCYGRPHDLNVHCVLPLF